MSLENGEVIYTFKRSKKPTYTDKTGQTVEAKFLELREPGMSHIGQYCKIKQTINGLIMNLTEVSEKYQNLGDGFEAGTEVKKFHEQDVDEHEENAKQMAQMLEFAFGLSENANMDHFLNDFQKMACNKRQSSICVVDNEQPMTETIWDKLHPQDAIDIALRWAAFFTMPSEFHQSIESEGQSEPHTVVKEL
jgi:hypothetical protein